LKAWSIDWLSGHCYHPHGFTAYVDPNPTISNALRCLGLFGPKKSATREVLNLTELLSQQIELERSDSGSYVIWGSYKKCCDFIPYDFTLLGTSSGFIPSLSLRYLAKNNHWHRQWIRFEHGAAHLSGLTLYDSGRITPPRDIAVTHPLTLQTELRNSRFALEELGLLKRSSVKRFETEAIQVDSYIQTQLFELAA
jgi:hypothetical protein